MIESLELFHSRLAERLKAHGAVAEFCRKTGFSRSLVDRWIDGVGAPALDSLDKVAHGLGVPAWELIKPEGDPLAQRMSKSALVGEIVVIIFGLNETQLNFILRLLRRRFVKDLVNFTSKRG